MRNITDEIFELRGKNISTSHFEQIDIDVHIRDFPKLREHMWNQGYEVDSWPNKGGATMLSLTSMHIRARRVVVAKGPAVPPETVLSDDDAEWCDEFARLKGHAEADVKDAFDYFETREMVATFFEKEGANPTEARRLLKRFRRPILPQ